MNILTGDREHLAKQLADHQDIQSVWYHGSALGSRYVKKQIYVILNKICKGEYTSHHEIGQFTLLQY